MFRDEIEQIFALTLENRTNVCYHILKRTEGSCDDEEYAAIGRKCRSEPGGVAGLLLGQ